MWGGGGGGGLPLLLVEWVSRAALQMRRLECGLGIAAAAAVHMPWMKRRS